MVCKKQEVDLTVSNSDTHVNSALFVYPIQIDCEEMGNSTHPCQSPTPTVNGCDLPLSTWTQTFQQEYSDLMASNRWHQHHTPATFPKSFPRRTQSFVFSRLTKHALTYLAYSHNFSKIHWSENLVYSAIGWTKPHWVSSSFGSIISRHLFSRRLAYTFPERLRRKMPQQLLRSFLSIFLSMGMIQSANFSVPFQTT